MRGGLASAAMPGMLAAESFGVDSRRRLADPRPAGELGRAVHGVEHAERTSQTSGLAAHCRSRSPIPVRRERRGYDARRPADRTGGVRTEPGAICDTNQCRRLGVLPWRLCVFAGARFDKQSTVGAVN